MIRRAMGYLKGLWLRLAAAAAMMIIASLSGLGVPILMGSMFDHNEKWRRTMMVLLAVLILGTLMKSMKNRLLSASGNHIAVKIRVEFM